MCLSTANEKMIEELLGKMTLKEKIGQLYQVGPSPVGGFNISAEDARQMLESGKINEEEYTAIIENSLLDGREDMIRDGLIGSFIGINDRRKANRLQKIAVEESRLKIPLIFSMDVVHGHKTIFPVPLGESCSFDRELFYQTARAAAKEAAEDNVNWTFAPMIDVSRDARWGRVAEGAGEDTYLTSVFAKAKVKGFQGDDLSSPDSIAACAKHFAAYGACEGGRDYNTTDMSLNRLNEVYLPPFAAAAAADCATFMAAFNDLNGLPCTMNPFLLKTVLREQWGFNGAVISDAHGIEECIAHGTAADPADAAAKALKAGVDMDMGTEFYTNHIEELLDSGKIEIKDIDTAVRNILRLKAALGLFERPYAKKPEKSCALSPEHMALAKKAAVKSAVLLKNTGVLPLDKKEKIAVVGFFADSAFDMLGTAGQISGSENDVITLVSELKNRNTDFTYSPCMDTSYKLNSDELNKTVSGCDTVIACIGERLCESGEANSRSDISPAGDQNKMISQLRKAGKKVITLLFTGRPMAISEAVENSDALLTVWHPGTQAGPAICDLLFGDETPSGKLTMTFPQNSGSMPVYYNHVPTGRPADETNWTSKYKDCPYTPLFPFGYGLSYTKFDYYDFKCEFKNSHLLCSVKIKNTGDFAGEETVQLYTHRLDAETTRPVKELKAFKKVFLLPGEEKTVEFSVPHSRFAYYDFGGNIINNKSRYEVFIAPDSASGEPIYITF